MTGTSATPPKLLDTDLSLGKDNDFQSMLDNFEKPSRSQTQEPSSVNNSADPVWLNPCCCFNIQANDTIDEHRPPRQPFEPQRSNTGQHPSIQTVRRKSNLHHTRGTVVIRKKDC